MEEERTIVTVQYACLHDEKGTHTPCLYDWEAKKKAEMYQGKAVKRIVRTRIITEAWEPIEGQV